MATILFFVICDMIINLFQKKKQFLEFLHVISVLSWLTCMRNIRNIVHVVSSIFALKYQFSRIGLELN